MKFRVTAKHMRENTRAIVGFEYCAKIAILAHKCGIDPDCYTAGVYGWNCDIWCINSGIYISSGYRPLNTFKLDKETRAIVDAIAAAGLMHFDDCEIDYETRVKKASEFLANAFQVIEKAYWEYLRNYVEKSTKAALKRAGLLRE